MKKIEQREQRIKKILSVSLDLFNRKGFDGTKTSDIAKAADMSDGLLFHYFENKEVLYLELIKNGCDGMDFFVSGVNDNPLLFLSNTVTDIFSSLKTNKTFAKMFVFMNNAQHMTEISNQANELLSQHEVIQQSIPLIENGQKMGQFKQGDPYALSVAFWCAIQGIAQELARTPDAPLPKVEWILDIVKSKGEA